MKLPFHWNNRHYWKFCRNFLHFPRTYSSANPEDHIIVSKQEKLHLIQINRPDKRNAINDGMAKQLIKAFQEFEKDDDAYVAVLYGKGENFCAGYDLKSLADGNSYGFTSEHGPVGPTRMYLEKPVIAAVNGYAVAGGFELTLWCDLRVIEENAIMGFFNRRFGVPDINGSTIRLPLLIGLSRALDLILTGRAINAKEAYEMGLANRIAPTGSGLEMAIDLAKNLCNFPQESLKVDRYSLYHTLLKSSSLEEAFKMEFENACRVLEIEPLKGAKKFVQGLGRHGNFSEDFKNENKS